jgi:hypothetical protein
MKDRWRIAYDGRSCYQTKRTHLTPWVRDGQGTAYFVGIAAACHED